MATKSPGRPSKRAALKEGLQRLFGASPTPSPERSATASISSSIIHTIPDSRSDLSVPKLPSSPPVTAQASVAAESSAVLTPSVPSRSPTPKVSSWWFEHREEIFSSVRQVLSVTEKVLDSVPVPGAKVAVGGVSELLKVFQVRRRPVRRIYKP
jgi:hypothetical protein